MTQEMLIALVCFMCAGRLMWSGSGEISTSTVIMQTRKRKGSREVWEYTLTHGLIPYLGWIKLVWSVPILIIGVQTFLNIHPTLIEMLMPPLKTLLKMKEQGILTIFFLISIGVFFTPDVLAWMFGDSRRIDRGGWGFF